MWHSFDGPFILWLREFGGGFALLGRCLPILIGK